MPQLREIAGDALLWPALEAAADADVAIVGAGSIVAFTHPLLASALYDAAAPADRRRAQRVLAESLDDPVERARHRARSIIAPDEAVAAELDRAAGISRGRGALQLAGELLQGAALATPAEADTAARLWRWLRAVDTYISAGDQVAAHTALDAAAVLASAAEEHAQVLARRARLADQYSGMRSLAEQALRLAPMGSEVRAEILTGLCSVHRMEGNGQQALRLGRMAVETAAAVNRPDVQLTALNELLACQLHWGQGQPAEVRRDIERLVGSCPQLPPGQVAWTRGFFAAWNDETAEDHVREGIRSAVETSGTATCPTCTSAWLCCSSALRGSGTPRPPWTRRTVWVRGRIPASRRTWPGSSSRNTQAT